MRRKERRQKWKGEKNYRGNKKWLNRRWSNRTEEIEKKNNE